MYMYVLMQADETINAIFPMRFRDDTDLAIATSFFQVGVLARIASIVAVQSSAILSVCHALVCMQCMMHGCSEGNKELEPRPSSRRRMNFLLQELQDVGNSFARAPKCSWSPIPPPELRGENVHHLTTNGGFVSFGT
jgi:hypothetical protein